MPKPKKAEPTSKTSVAENNSDKSTEIQSGDEDYDIPHVERVIAKRKFTFNDKPDNIISFDAQVTLGIMNAIGTDDTDFFDVFVNQLISIGSQGRKPDPKGANFALSVVKGIEPRDQIEAMLAAQMAAVHNATMATARSFNHATTIDQLAIQERTLNKLARTYVAQMEGLKRYRTGGEQKVTVEHVTVNAGGQAIVGSVDHGGSRKKRNATT